VQSPAGTMYAKTDKTQHNIFSV